ncbi:MAG: YgjV family protein [Clostridia bacterium]|nr:YgjV family protein [Clostridia bacterium]
MFPEIITTNYIISQVIGFIALILVMLSYFVGTKKKQITITIISNLFIAISFGFLGTYTACIGMLIATVRTIIFFIYELKLKVVPEWMMGLIFLVLVFNSAIFMPFPIMDFLPMISLMLYTLGLRIKKLIYMRIFFILPPAIFFIYDIYVFAYTDALLKILELTAIAFSVSRFFVRKYRFEKAMVTEELQGEMEEISDD